MDTEHLLNIGSILLNLVFVYQLKSLQNTNEQSKYWKEKSMMQQDELEQQAALLKKFRAKVQVYEKFHGHKPLAYSEKKGI